MKATLKALLAAALLAGAAAAASAQELKIGYVNSDRVLREAVPAKAAQAKLEAEFSKREKDLNDIATGSRRPATSSTRTRRRSPKPSARGASATWSTRTASSSASAASSRKT